MFETFEDQRQPEYEPPAQPERDFWEQPDLNEAVPRGDIIVEAPDASGWQGTGPAIVTDDRQPAEATSGNRLLTVLLFFSGLATSVSLWLFDTQADAAEPTATTQGFVTVLQPSDDLYQLLKSIQGQAKQGTPEEYYLVDPTAPKGKQVLLGRQPQDTQQRLIQAWKGSAGSALDRGNQTGDQTLGRLIHGRWPWPITRSRSSSAA